MVQPDSEADQRNETEWQPDTSSRFWHEPNLAPTRVRRQHYVPQFYLRSFVASDKRFDIVDLESGTRRRASPGDVAWQSNFNDVTSPGACVSTEAWLANIEDAAAPIVKRLVDKPDTVTSLSYNEEMALARFLATLRFRVPQFRSYIEGIQTQIGSQIRKLLERVSTQPGNQALTLWWDQHKDKPYEWFATRGEPVDTAGVAALQLGEVTGFANLLRAMPWRIGRVPTQVRLFTSDNPLSGYLNPVQVMRIGAAPFTAYQYFTPLSPSVLLRIGPLDTENEGTELRPQGGRLHRDFPMWDALFALDVVTSVATRFLFGDVAYRSRKLSNQNLERIDASAVQFQYFLGRKPVPSKFFPSYDDL